MTAVQGQCPDCKGYYRLEQGRVPVHHPRDPDPLDPDAHCTGSGALPKTDDDYPVGRDTDPWVYPGGAWEQNRRQH